MIDWSNIHIVACNALEMLAYAPGKPLVFSSGLFWALFLVFLPIYALLINRRTAMLTFVTVFSLYFYYRCSGWAVLLLIATTLIDYRLAQLIADEGDKRRRRLLLLVSILCSVGVLFIFKYSNFVLWNFSAIIGANFQPIDLLLPVGISFYTFRTVSYVTDVYRGKMRPVTSVLDYAFFLSFFPCLIAGPIVRAVDFFPQLEKGVRASREQVYSGLWLIMLGVVKKAIIADYLAQYNNLVFDSAGGYSSFETIMAVIGYSMQIYCDFSGYSDMAIGLGRIMGFDLGENFEFPYKSRSVSEFWHRWHISLSTWLRDYIYIPLGGNRNGKWRTQLNLMTTMLLGGLWHGAAWNFVIWGACHGAALSVHKQMLPFLKKIPSTNYLWQTLSLLVTFSLVSVLWVFFRSSSLGDALSTLNAMMSGGITLRGVLAFVSVRHTWCFMLAVVVVFHFIPRLFYDDLVEWFVDTLWIVKLIIFVVVVQLVLEFRVAEVQPFIYYQF